MIHTPTYIMLSLILPVIILPYQLHHHVIMHEVAVLDEMQGFPDCPVVVPGAASLPNIGPDRSVMLPEVFSLGQVCMFIRRIHLTQKQLKKSVTICTVTKDVESGRPRYYTHTQIISPHWCQRHKPHSDAVQITGISCQRSVARRNNGAKSEDDDTPTVTSRQYGRRAIFVPGDVRHPR